MNYLYNGVELADAHSYISETGIVYVLVYQNAEGQILKLQGMSTGTEITGKGYLIYSDGYLVRPTDGDIIYAGIDYYDGEKWVYIETTGGDRISLDGITLIWTSMDIANESGGVYFAATDPIPVATGLTIRCPDSVRQGLFIIVACDTAEQSYVDFTCTMSGHTSSKTKLMQNTEKSLRLQCGSDEGAAYILLEVESGGETAMKQIAVLPYGGGGGGGNVPYDPTSRVTDISMFAFPDTVAPGGYSIMLVNVNGEGDYSQRITAEISGHTSAETQYFSDGYFCNIAVGKDETAESILVTITSAQDPTVSASVWVNVDHSGDTPIDPGTDEERLRCAFWKGFAAAAAQGFRLPPVKVLKYLYNGFSLPDNSGVYTPELQKSHPYAVMNYGELEGIAWYATMRVSSNPFVYYDEYLDDDGNGYEVGSTGSWVIYKITNRPDVVKLYFGDAWVEGMEAEVWAVHDSGQTDGIEWQGAIKWSSHDILNSVDGSVYFDGSDPDPVYE